MKNRYKMLSFKKEVTPLLELVCNDINLESVWLSVMSMLEDIAAQYILSNINEKTPESELRGIINHIKDEQRHARVLLEMRPVKTYSDIKYYQIEEKWKKIGKEFIMAFFNSQELREANHRYAAYVHGAQTIERFPFRIYNLYLTMTSLPIVKAELPRVIDDESEHIEFGQKMYAGLSEEEQMPLSDLYRLEENICLMMLIRMKIALKELLDLERPVLNNFVARKCATNPHFETAFNHALNIAEGFFSEERADYLKIANTLARLELRNNAEYKELEKACSYFVTKYVHSSLEAKVKKEVIQNRFDHFYNTIIYNTDSMALHYAYFKILESHSVDADSDATEEKNWTELNIELLQVLKNEDSLSVSWA